MRLANKILLILVFTSILAKVRAQPFSEDIRAFRKQDSIQFPTPNSILFVGSSSFTKWNDVKEYFPGYPIINRGFGGSSLPDLIRYADQIIFPYQPKQILIYCGDNDIAFSDTVSATTVFARFTRLFFLIREKMPEENIVFVAIKPSPSRASQKKRQDAANAMIREFLAKQSNAYYVDIVTPMINENGKPKPEIFEADSLHMNAKGYAIWQKAILPYLKN